MERVGQRGAAQPPDDRAPAGQQCLAAARGAHGVVERAVQRGLVARVAQLGAHAVDPHGREGGDGHERDGARRAAAAREGGQAGAAADREQRRPGQRVARLARVAGLGHEGDERHPGQARRGRPRGGRQPPPGHGRERQEGGGDERGERDRRGALERGEQRPRRGRRRAGVGHPRPLGGPERVARPEPFGHEPQRPEERRPGRRPRAQGGTPPPQPDPVGAEERPGLGAQEAGEDAERERAPVAVVERLQRGGEHEREEQPL
jgi:hypothetical protein